MKHVLRTPPWTPSISCSIRSVFRSTRARCSLQLSRRMTAFMFSTWNQSSTSIDMTAGDTWEPAGLMPGLSGAGTREHDGCRLGGDDEVEDQTSVLDVVEVVGQLLESARSIGGVPAANLRPSRDPGLDEMPTTPVRHHFFEQSEQFRSLRAGADKAHLASNDVPQLRQLVESSLPQELADSRYATVVVLGPQRLSRILRPIDH